MPSFNELYYGGIGNTDLRPELINQFNYTYTHERYHYKRDMRIVGAVYVNEVRDKILSIPTKNLFVWSMQNVERVLAYGAEVDFKFTRKFHSDSKLIIDLNYSFQRAIDITNELSPTYGHQIAYVPIHTGNISLTEYFYDLGMRLSSYFISSRYVLNENVYSNLESGFVTTDITLFYKYNLKKKSKSNFTLQATVKNIFNVQYAYVRSFSMPGTNFIFSLSYAFN